MNKINKINVCCQKVLPLVYDESLSYYEVLCKVIQKLNELIKINNNIRDEIHKEYTEILESAKTVTEAVASVTAMRDEVLTLKQATEQYAHDVVTVYNETVQARDTAIAKANTAEQSAATATEKADIAKQSANTATQSATVATTKASEAQTSANNANQYANEAKKSATLATTKANEAQTSANNAKQYANEAKESAGLVGQDVTQLKQDVNNLQSSVSKNTSDISSLATKVDNNTSDISSLSTKVDNNTSQISTLNSMLDVYWKTIYPIGSIYISTTSTFNPNTAWGGTWEKTAEGRCLIGASTDYPLGSTGGEGSHTLTENELPLIEGRALGVSTYGSASSGHFNIKKENPCALNAGTGSNDLSEVYFGFGGNLPHNNMQPYLAVYMWKRTA